MMIDTHHHFVTQTYADAVDAVGGDPSGYHVPVWSAESSEKFMAGNGKSIAILSLTAPGAPIARSTEGSRKLARQCNEFCAQLRDQKPDKFGFFAALPNLLDTEGALAEIEYALSNLKADGVTVFTRYGDGPFYLGHKEYDPIWKEFDRRGAVVFVHPTHPVDTDKVNPSLSQPHLDYPHETGRTAMDMITSGTRRRFPNCKVILSHAGGMLPWILPRVTYWRRGLSVDQIPDGVTYETIMDDFRSFYFDTALSTSHLGLDLLLKKVPADHVLYGSDFPYAVPTLIANFREDMESYKFEPGVKEKICYRNALDLIPRLKQYYP